MKLNVATFVSLLLVPVAWAPAITIRHDVSDSAYTNLADSQHPYGGLVLGEGFLGSGTLISPDWILTAAHVLSGNVTFVNSAGSIPIIEQVFHPSWDIGLARIASPINTIDPVDLYSLDFGIEDGQESIILGAGNTGTGLTGQQGGSGGTRRAAQTYVHANADAWGWGSHRLLTWFRSPGRGAGELEGGSSQGDSGGGLLLEVDGQHAVAGVLSLAWWGGSGGDTIGKYDTGGVFVRSAPLNDWILEHATDATVVTQAAGPTDFQWVADLTGSWLSPSNWSPAGVPNGNNHTVRFTGSGTANTQIRLDASAAVRDILFDDSSSYRLTGGNILYLDADTASASVTVKGGYHSIRTRVDTQVATTIDIAAGAGLVLAAPLDLGGTTLTKQGAGALFVDGPAIASSGIIDVQAGLLGGSGDVGGTLRNLSGVVSPGHHVGELSVAGHYILGGDGTLQIDISGAAPSEYDRLEVGGHASLAGSLNVAFTDGFEPRPGQRFEIISARVLRDRGLSVTGPAADVIGIDLAADRLVLEVLSDSDFNGDGLVNGDDFLIWQAGFGVATSGLRRDGDADRDGDVDGDDFVIWQQHFAADADNGFQVSGVPEPSTLWLVVAGAALVLITPDKTRHEARNRARILVLEWFC